MRPPAPAPHHLEPNAARVRSRFRRRKPPRRSVRACCNRPSSCSLDEEKVATVFGGDTVDWVFDAGHVASRFISVKPKLANATTDIHIVSDHGNEYTLQLQEVSSDADDHFDSKIFLVPGDKTAKDRLTEMPVFVPAADLEKARQDAAAAKAAQTAELKAEEVKAETYRSRISRQPSLRLHMGRKKG